MNRVYGIYTDDRGRMGAIVVLGLVNPSLLQLVAGVLSCLLSCRDAAVTFEPKLGGSLSK